MKVTVGSSRMRKLGCPERTAASCRRRRSPPLSDLTCRASGLQSGKRKSQLIQPLEREASGASMQAISGQGTEVRMTQCLRSQELHEMRASMADCGAPPAGVADSWQSPAAQGPPLGSALASAAPSSSEPSSCQLPPCRSHALPQPPNATQLLVKHASRQTR